MLQFLSPHARLHPPQPLLTDLAWIQDLLTQMPNELPLFANQSLDVGWWGDASSSFGIGVTVGQFWGIWSWHPGFTVGPNCLFDIGWAEAVAVELGLLMVLHHSLINLHSNSSRILVRSDNSGVVTILNKGRSRSENTNVVLKRIYSTLAQHHFYLRGEHVSGHDNIANALSCGDISGFLARFLEASRRSSLVLPAHLQGCLTSL